MSYFFPTRQECSAHTIFPGVHIASCAIEKMLLSMVTLEPNSVVEEHSHPHEQMGVLLEGEMTFFIGGESKVVKPGDVWRIPGNVVHKVINGPKPSKAVDIFSPIRQEYL